MPSSTTAVALVAIPAAILTGAITAVSPFSIMILLLVVGMIGLFVIIVSLPLFGERGTPAIAFNRMLLWMMAINVPAIIAFDTSGLTRLNIFNPQSYGRILMFLMIGALFLLGRLVQKAPARQSRDGWQRSMLLVALLFAWYAVDAPLVSSGQDLVLSLYRAAEWFLVLALLYVVVRDALALGQDNAQDLLRIMLPIAFFPAAVNLIVFPLVPSLVYHTSITGPSRFGGVFTNPVLLGALVTLIIFFALSEWRGWKRYCAVAVCLIVLAATYSRGPWAAFVVSSAAYVLIRVRSAAARILIICVGLIGVLGIYLSDELVNVLLIILQRGQPAQHLTTLSERATIWEAAREMIALKPTLGWGFVAGPKHLADIMATMPIGKHFVSPSAHNEVLEAWISGGVPAVALSVLIQLRAGALCFLLRKVVDRPTYAVLVSWLVVMLMYGFLQPLISTSVRSMAVMFVFFYVAMELAWRRYSARAREHHKTAGSMMPHVETARQG